MTRWNGLRSIVVVAAVAIGLVMPTPASAWVAFAKITTSAGTTIDGDSIAKGYEKQIVVLGVGNRMDLPVTTSTTGGASVGRLQLGGFQIVKGFDSATPKLVTAMGVGNGLPKVEITIFKTTTTGTSVPGFKITLSNAIITQMDTTYDPGATPSTLEKIELFYTKLQWTDLITGATGSTP